MSKDSSSNYHIATRAIHSGSEPDPQTGAVIVPIYQTSTYAQEAPGVCKGYEYSRTDNPTRTAYQTALASLEDGKYGLAFASGLAAIDALFKTLRPGDHVISGDDIYGGTYRLFTNIFQKQGIEFDFTELSGEVDLERFFKPNTKMVWMESPTNPLLKVADIKRICDTAHARNVPVMVDNTFMSPILQRPLELGADLVLHSTTKYIGGHSDTVGGAIITSNQELYDQLKYIQNAAGAVPGPFDCFIAHRGIKTLAVRMQRHCENAVKIAEFLENHSKVEKVIYPFLDSHPQADIARRQQKAGGGMISFIIKDGKEKALEIVSKTKVFTLAESLGGVESLIEHPGVMTHASIPQEIREEKGLSDSLIRLSVGIEHIDDLIADLDAVL